MSADRVIWKFPLTLSAEQAIDMPADPRLLHVGLDPSRALCLWADVEPGRPSRARLIHLAGTGHWLTEGFATGTHIGTVLDGSFVWHVFDGGPA